MEERVNLNLRASNYIPRNKRQTAGDNQRTFDNQGIEVIYEYQGGGHNPKAHDLSGAANYYSYNNNNYQNQGNNYQENTNNYKGGKKNNYSSNYNNSNYQNKKNNNQPQSYSENYYDDINKSGNYYYNEVKDSTSKYYNKNTYSGINTNTNTNSNYINKNNYSGSYTNINSNYNYNKDEDNYQGQNKKNYGNKNFYKNTGNYNYDNNYSESNYNKGYVYEKVENKNYCNKSQQNFKIIEKDVSDVIKVSREDLEDDYYNEGNFTADISDLKGDFEKEDDLLYDDYKDDLDYYDEDGDYGTERTTEKFSEMNLGNNSYSKNSREPTQTDQDFISDNNSKKPLLVFSNKDSFTDYVEEMIKKERKNNSHITDSTVNILMIAEKPSIAKTLSEAIGGKVKSVKMGKGKGIFVFDGYFGNVKARFTVSSVMGHVYTSDFQSAHNNWSAIDYLDLYDVPVAKLEANRKTRIPELLQKLARGKDILCLWLDCDKEGENICYEVIYNIYPYMNKKHYQQIYRAKFSSLTKPDLKAAFNKMKEPPNKNESLAVDARQVIDLKIGVSFTRFLTSAVLPGIKNIDTSLLSYGPCQTPTLWFCVNRQNEIDKFISKEYFKVYAEIEHLKMRHKIPYRHKFYDKHSLNEVMKKIKEATSAKVVAVLTNKNQKQPPVGMNTVQMLRIASSFLKMSPHGTMVVAEKLYTMGYITYPRTETTKYAGSFDFVKALNDFADHPTFGKSVSNMLKSFRRPVLRGVDVGDHPPITPSRVASQKDLSPDYWKLYELICLNFFASLAEAAEYEEKTFQIDINGEIFEADSSVITKEGFLAFTQWKRKNYVKDFPILKQDTIINVHNTSYESHWTEPPDHLSESDLLKLMEHNKIGTDASMPVHIENITQRGYVKVDASRRLIPTKLGKALIESISSVEPDLVQPTIRSEIETFVDQVAKGNKKFQEALSYTIQLYKKKFLIVRQYYEKILNGFKKYFDIDLMEMNKVYQTIKNKNEALRIQNTVKKSASQVDSDLNTCSTCNKGKMYVEYDEFDKYLLLCTNCKLRKKVISDAIKLKVNKNLKCQSCSSFYVEVEVENPFLSGETEYTGCLFCDPNLK